jgi:vacuolar-type H+-ATPase subunit I/STV1
MFTKNVMTDEKMRFIKRIQELESEINLLKAENNTIRNKLNETQNESLLAEQIKRSLC